MRITPREHSLFEIDRALSRFALAKRITKAV
jgi:hypothetical protein